MAAPVLCPRSWDRPAAPSKDFSDEGSSRDTCLPLAGRVTSMTRLIEYNARAALCRRLAKLEPVSRDIWLAEAERWTRLAQASMGAQDSEDGAEAPEGASQSLGDAVKEDAVKQKD
jgi:hypothetical protein